jgi:hypothetical protein
MNIYDKTHLNVLKLQCLQTRQVTAYRNNLREIADEISGQVNQLDVWANGSNVVFANSRADSNSLASEDDIFESIKLGKLFSDFVEAHLLDNFARDLDLRIAANGI